MVGVYLALDLPVWNKNSHYSLSESPELKLLFERKISEGNLTFPAGAMEIWLSGADRPIQWKKKSGLFYITREKGQFRFGGHKESWDWVKLKPLDGKFKYNNMNYEGELWLYPVDDSHFSIVLGLEIEKYIAKVISQEMSSHWPLETLKAQAIAARSFAHYHKEKNEGKNFHLLMGPQAQAIRGEAPSQEAIDATFLTYGMVLKQSEKTLLAYYHSTCGGDTRNFRQGDFKYTSVKCESCRNSPHYHWQVDFERGQIEKMLESWLPAGVGLRHAKVIVEVSGHVKQVVFTPDQGKAISINSLDFRRHLNKHFGKEIIKSLRFDLHIKADKLKILGRGWGYHGIGMCQYGARGMGQKFMTCRSILDFYYPLTSIELLPYSQ